MNFLVIGLGSMGKRRIRCLKSLGFNNIYGFDIRDDRITETKEKYGIETFSDFNFAIKKSKPSAFIISVPPDLHHIYMLKAIENNIHFFVEASVTNTNIDEIKEKLKKSNIIAAPSATSLFLPSIKKIFQIVNEGSLGKLSNIIYHTGQYLPDWHSYEDVSDFYVSNPTTGGAREMVPFELTWLVKLFGFPKKVFGNFRKTISIKGAESIDDTYNFLLDYDEFLATITIDVVSRYATRSLLINGDKKQLIWNWDKNYVSVFNPSDTKWENITYEKGIAEEGYNPNISENHYIEEIRSFVESIKHNRSFINSIENDYKILKLLYTIEESDKKSKALEVNF